MAKTISEVIKSFERKVRGGFNLVGSGYKIGDLFSFKLGKDGRVMIHRKAC